MKAWIFKGRDASKSKQPRKELDQGRPYDVDTLIEAYYQNSYHASCINLKTICILGNGIESDEAVRKLEEIVREDSVFTLLHKTILDLRIFGDAFWEVVKTGAGVEIYHMPSWTMSLGKSGNWVQEAGRERQEFEEGSVWHFKENCLKSHIWGSPDYLPLIEDGTLEEFSTIKSYNRNFFGNNAIPDSIMFIKGGDIGPQTESTLQRFFRQKFGGLENAGKFCVAPVPEGVEIQLERLQTVSDGKFLGEKDSLLMEIVSCHGVPPRLAGIMIPGSLGGGGETAGELEIFLRTRVQPMQNIFGGQLDVFFREVLGMQTDISFAAIEGLTNGAEVALQALKG